MRRATSQASVTEQFRNEVAWRRKMLSSCLSRQLRFGKNGGFVWRPRLPLLREHALSMGQDAVGDRTRASSLRGTHASSLRGRGVALGDRFIQSACPKLWMREGVDWEELWVLKAALESRGECQAGKLALVRLGNSNAVAYSNYGAGKAG